MKNQNDDFIEFVLKGNAHFVSFFETYEDALSFMRSKMLLDGAPHFNFKLNGDTLHSSFTMKSKSDDLPFVNLLKEVQNFLTDLKHLNIKTIGSALLMGDNGFVIKLEPVTDLNDKHQDYQSVSFNAFFVLDVPSAKKLLAQNI